MISHNIVAITGIRFCRCVGKDLDFTRHTLAPTKHKRWIVAQLEMG